ncbi:MAG: hypothetical protein HW412_56 [Bacteroidetes bacterium]|nr:hypothetical protein [Bacteroidota bacterium]
MITRVSAALALMCSLVSAQEFVVRGVRVYGRNDEQNVPVIMRDSSGRADPGVQYITIQFDVQAKEPPAIKIRFLHCNRDWEPDNNLFVQDETHNTSFILNYRPSPNGVEFYSYRYRNRFPDKNGIVRFNYSGNRIFRLMDKQEKNVYGEGRFFVVDDVSRVGVSVMNDYLTSASPPLNQIHKVKVDVRLPNEIDGFFYSTVDIYQNRRFFNPYRVDVNDRDPYTTVEGFNFGYRLFTALNILSGNEYRTLNIGNVTQYPHKSLVHLVEGVDQPRMYWRTGPDRNGTALLRGFSGIASDYLNVLFRLDLSATNIRSAGVYVVGPFNQWNPADEDKLVYDDAERCYVVKKLLRRGIYDYQYVTGIQDETAHKIVNQNWVALEGNDWRTTNTYHAIVYYNDPRFGGFDLIAGFGIGNSSGSAN